MSTATIERVARTILPEDGEDQPSFAVRFHSAMQKAIPDVDARNQAMFDAWFEHGDDLLDEAEETFTPDRYFRKAEPVCEFAEHVANHEDGSQTHYNRDALIAMCRNLNRRIDDTGNFGSLTDGHTPEDINAQQPSIIGHVGPWYIGQIGRTQPRWAIFATEHYRRDREDRVRELPHRSAEVWRYNRVQDRLIDPVAAISETPRLDMGMVRYGRRTDGVTIEKYSAAAMPGAMNTFVPSDKYADDAGTDPDVSEDDGMPDMDDSTIERIAQRCTNLFLELPEIQFVRSLMQSGDDGADASGDEVAGDAMDAAAGADPGQPPAPEVPQDDTPETDQYGDDDQPPEGMDAGAGDQFPQTDEPTSTAGEASPPADTGASMGQIEQLEARIAELESQLQNTAQEKRDMYRRDRFRTMRSRGHQIDVDGELQMTADFNDEQFDRYAKRLEATSTRVPLANVVGALPEGIEVGEDAPVSGSDPKMERYSAAAVAHVKRERAAGRPCDFGDALKRAIAGELTT